ncbi:MAG TPA: hypothetical protein VGJ93_03160 [Desulfuromonadaceae bacterium]|jgi:hypothetical protein
MKKNAFFVIFLFIVHLLAACGGGSGSNNTVTASPVLAKGIFVDGPVNGLGFQSGSKSGITGNNGEFEYEQGKNVKFYLGDIIIGETTGEPVVTLLHLVPGADTANAKVTNIARFLLSVGKVDPQTKNITISEGVFTAAKGKTIDFNVISEPDLLEMVRILNNDRNSVLVSIEEATNEVTANILKIYGGTYQGTFMGPAASTKWELTIDPTSGLVTGKGLDGSQEKIDGNITKGIIFDGKAQLGCSLTGSINVSTKDLSGTWYFSTDLARKGTFVGKKI